MLFKFHKLNKYLQSCMRKIFSSFAAFTEILMKLCRTKTNTIIYKTNKFHANHKISRVVMSETNKILK